MGGKSSKSSLNFQNLSRNQVSPEPDLKLLNAFSNESSAENDSIFSLLPNKCKVMQNLHEDIVSSEGNIIASIQRKWNLPKDPKIMIHLIGSYDSHIGNKGKVLFSIRDFLTQLIQLTIREDLWMLINGEDGTLFKSFGNLLQSITLPTSQYSPAVIGLITQQEDVQLTVGLESLINSLNPNIKNYIITSSNLKTLLKKKGGLECVILCNGTENTLAEFIDCMDNKLPAIILKGSGGIADVLAEIAGLEEMVNQTSSMQYCVEAIFEKVKCRKTLVEALIDRIVKKEIHFYVLDIKKTIGYTNLSESILTAMHVSHVDNRSLLMLTVKLDHLELAAELGQLWKLVDDNDYECCKKLLIEALRLKKYNFVRYMIEQGLNPADYIDEQDITKKFWMAIEFNRKKQPEDNLKPTDTQKKKKLKKERKMFGFIAQFCGDSNALRNDFKIERLFKLAIMTKKFELSEIFWRYVKYPTGGALFACHILRIMKKSVQTIDEKEKIISQKRRYQELAMTTLNNTYSKYPDDAINLLSQNMPQWQNQSCIDLALQMKNKQFLSHKACQELNKKKWQNKLNEHLVKNLVGRKSKFQLLIKQFVSPKYKAFFALVGHVIFLILYAVLLVSLLEPDSFHVLEWIVWSFIICHIFEILRQILSSVYLQLLPFFMLQVASVFLFLVAFFMKIEAYYDSNHPGWMEAARIVFSMDYILFCFSILEFYYIIKFLGPLLMTIKQMAVTLLKFLLIIMVFYVAFAIAAQTVLYPHTAASGELAYSINLRPFWSIFGEFNFDDLKISNTSCSNDPEIYNSNNDIPRCPTESGYYYVPVLMAFYVVLINILLLNLLIATFNSAIKKTEETSYEIWCYQNLQFTFKYSSVIFLPPPFILLFPLFLVYSNSDDSKLFTQNEIKDDYEGLKVRRIETEQRDAVLKDMDTKNSERMFQREIQIECPHKEVGEIGIDLMLKVNKKIKHELKKIRAEMVDIQRTLYNWGYTPDSTFSVDKEDYESYIKSMKDDQLQCSSSPQPTAFVTESENREPSQREDLVEDWIDSAPKESFDVTPESPGQATTSQELRWIPKYGSIVATRLSSEAETILQNRDPSRKKKRYFACRTYYKYGVRWKIISVKKKAFTGQKDVPIASKKTKAVKKVFADALGPDLKLL